MALGEHILSECHQHDHNVILLFHIRLSATWLFLFPILPLSLLFIQLYSLCLACCSPTSLVLSLSSSSSFSIPSICLLFLFLQFSLLHVQFFWSKRKHLLYIIASLGTCFKELIDTILHAKLYGFLLCDFSFLFQITPISNQVDHYITASVLLHFFQPVINVHECIFSSNIICQEYAVSASVEYPSNWSKGFLSCSVPNLEFHYFVF